MQAKNALAKSPSLWQKIAALEPNPAQLIFDITFGIIAPILCIVLDPGIFRFQENLCIGILARYSLFAYIFCSLGIVTLALWLVARTQLKRVAAFIAGIFAVGASLTFGLGLVLALLSVISIVVIGTILLFTNPSTIVPFFGLALLGFMPLLTSLVCIFNCRRAWEMAVMSNNPLTLHMRLSIAVVGAGLILGLPALGQQQLPKLYPTLTYSVPVGCSD